MKVALGSTSEDKQKLLEEALLEYSNEIKIVGVGVDSGIVDQPLDEETTTKGAFNRAKEAGRVVTDCDFSIGLEGGLSLVRGDYYLICVAVIIDKDNKNYVGVSSKFPLPKKVSELVKQGKKFGVEIRKFEKETETDSNLASVVSNLIKRDVAFREAIKNSYLAYRNREYY